MQPLVSIIIPYFNHEAYIREAVLSAASQSYANVEVIVVDDGSTNPVAPLLADLPDIRMFRTANAGCSAARNAGVRASRGTYLLFLDGDDRLLPDGVEAGVRALMRRPDAALAFGAVRLIDEHGDVTGPPHICRPRRDYFLMFLESCPIVCPAAALIRRDAFIEAGCFDDTLPGDYGEDYDLYLRMTRRAPAVRHTTCVVDYRIHSSNCGRDKPALLAGILAALDKMAGDGGLTPRQRRRLELGRRRWTHALRPQATIAHRLCGLYFRCRAMLTVPLSAYFRR